MFRFPGLLLIAISLLGAACAGRSDPPVFEAARVVADVEMQCAFGPRVPGSAARDSVAARIGRRLSLYGARMSMQSWQMDDPHTPGRRLALMNVIGSFAPDRTRRVLLLAHYDSRPWADQDSLELARSQPIAGAIDGAAGTAILLEMARLFSQRMPDDIGVDVVFFDGEDYGTPDDYTNYLLGAKYFAANLGGYRPECALLLDMVGGEGTTIAREGYSRDRSPALVDSVFARARRLGLDYFAEVDAAHIYDDHVPLLQAGIHAIDIFGYDYPWWHTAGDTPERCDPARIDQVGRLLVDFVYRYDYEPR